MYKRDFMISSHPLSMMKVNTFNSSCACINCLSLVKSSLLSVKTDNMALYFVFNSASFRYDKSLDARSSLGSRHPTEFSTFGYISKHCKYQKLSDNHQNHRCIDHSSCKRHCNQLGALQMPQSSSAHKFLLVSDQGESSCPMTRVLFLSSFPEMLAHGQLVDLVEQLNNLGFSAILKL
mmetsp:Transcript_34094/g.52314  ORF Transcript_34094/g.52314 Transcript_34094/m.52314 type:complete len:178 (-) Transcript_34094:186-719(-)